jgi:large subunit ribosomal protein L9
MAQEIILMESVKGLGEQGEIVKVAEGYARNYLLPRKLAEPVTEAARRRVDKKRKEAEALQTKVREEAAALAARIGQASCTISVKTGAEGKLFGSVGPQDIAESLKKQGLVVDRHAIALADPIKELGVFKVPVRLMAGVETEVKVWVVEA